MTLLCLRKLARSTGVPGLAVVAALGLAADAASPNTDPPLEVEAVEVFDRVEIHWDKERPELEDPDGYVVRHEGHTVDRTVELPAAPASLRDERRITITVVVEPIESRGDGFRRPNDRWTRVGNVSVLVPGPAGEPDADDDDNLVETELIRFVTGYGAAGTYEQDITSFAPLLHGTAMLRAHLSSYSEEPGWRISARLTYTVRGVGPRRPAFAAPLLFGPHVTAERRKLEASIVIPPDLGDPRIRITSTGHATDGMPGNEFLTCPHILRIDGREIARWRPWAERGGDLRARNPWAGRSRVDGRELHASDLDRSGWHPGLVVETLIIPVPELTPGRHRVEVEILGIRPRDPPTETGVEHHGYFFITASVVADEPWPAE